MSIYIGQSENDANFCFGSNLVARSVYIGSSKVWPLYEFSFYDGKMQKVREGIAASGEYVALDMRSCEDTWWHRLQFDTMYSFDQTSKSTWLCYNAIELQVSKKSTHWLECTVNKGSISPKNSDKYQTVSFNDDYTDSSLNSKSSTAINNVDTTLTCQIYKNEWFAARSGKMYCIQYDEWAGYGITGTHQSGSISKWSIEEFSHTLSPSDNRPTIYFTQLANSWGNNEQQIEFTCTPEITGYTGGDVTLTWKIYSNSTSGSTIYYGTNIASNNETFDATCGEVYREGYMWITSSNPYIQINTDTIKHTISDDGVCVWTCTATWGANDASGDGASHNIIWKGVPESIGADGWSGTITATCEQSSEERNNIFTLNVGSKNNWRSASATCTCKQEGQSGVNVDCYVSEKSDCSDKQTLLYISIPALQGGDKTYVLYEKNNKQSVGPSGNDTFILVSYYTQESVNGVVTTVYAKCPQDSNVTSKTFGQSSLDAAKVFVPHGSSSDTVSISCTNADTSHGQLITTNDSTNCEITCTVPEHYALGSTGTITCDQHDDNNNVVNTVTLSHLSNAAIDYNYTYKLIITGSCDESVHKQSFEADKDATKGEAYAKLYESCTATQGGEDRTDLNYTDRLVTYDSTNTVANLADVSIEFKSSSDWIGTQVTGKKGDSCVKLDLNGSANNKADNSVVSYSDIRLTVDEYCYDIKRIIVTKANSNAFTFKVKVEELGWYGGSDRSGSIIATFGTKTAVSSWSQPTSCKKEAAKDNNGNQLTQPVSGQSFAYQSTSRPNDFEISSVTETSTAGTYEVTVKTKTDYVAETTGNNKYTDGSVSMEMVSSNTHNVTSTGDKNKEFKVKLVGGKTYTTVKDGTESDRDVEAYIGISDSNYVTSCKRKQTPAPNTVCGQIITGKTVKWKITDDSPSDSNDFVNSLLSGGTGAASDYYYNLSFNVKQADSGSTTQTKTVKVKAYLEGSENDIYQIFYIVWPKAEEVGPTEWNFTYQYKVNNESSDNHDVSFNTEIDNVTQNDGINSNKGDAGKAGNSWTSNAITVTVPIGESVNITMEIKEGTKVMNWISKTVDSPCNVVCDYTWSESKYEITNISNDITVCPKTDVTLTYKLVKDNKEISSDHADIIISDTNLFKTSPDKCSVDSSKIHKRTLVAETGSNSAKGGESLTATIKYGTAEKTVTINIFDIWVLILNDNDNSTSCKIPLTGQSSFTWKFTITKNGTEYIGTLPDGWKIVGELSGSNSDTKTLSSTADREITFTVPSTFKKGTSNVNIEIITPDNDSSWCSCCSVGNDDSNIEFKETSNEGGWEGPGDGGGNNTVWVCPNVDVPSNQCPQFTKQVDDKTDFSKDHGGVTVSFNPTTYFKEGTWLYDNDSKINTIGISKTTSNNNYAACGSSTTVTVKNIKDSSTNSYIIKVYNRWVIETVTNPTDISHTRINGVTYNTTPDKLTISGQFKVLFNGELVNYLDKGAQVTATISGLQQANGTTIKDKQCDIGDSDKDNIYDVTYSINDGDNIVADNAIITLELTPPTTGDYRRGKECNIDTTTIGWTGIKVTGCTGICGGILEVTE